MRAVVRTEYGSPDVVRIVELPKPTPADNEVLVKVVAASVNGSDREAVIGNPRTFGWVAFEDRVTGFSGLTSPDESR